MKKYYDGRTPKKGDRVKLCNKASSYAAKIGATGKVIGFAGSYSSEYIVIEWDRNELSGGQCNGGYYPNDFVSLKPSTLRSMIED